MSLKFSGVKRRFDFLIICYFKYNTGSNYLQSVFAAYANYVKSYYWIC